MDTVNQIDYQAAPPRTQAFYQLLFEQIRQTEEAKVVFSKYLKRAGQYRCATRSPVPFAIFLFSTVSTSKATVQF